jgi:anti-sigma regulatory factor (Ser/Thr protein kinase)
MLHPPGDGSLRTNPAPRPPWSDNNRDFLSGWPLRTFLELGALPSAVPCARLHVRLVLCEWGLSALGYDSELVTSELLSNAIAAIRELPQIATVRLWVLCDGSEVLILVADASGQLPARAEPDDDAEAGRGLLLVEAISVQWGCFFPQDGTPGKVTWALIGDKPQDGL